MALVAARERARRRRPARAVIISPPRSTVIARDGAVHSVQAAELTLDRAELDRMWTPANLENLARTYWRFLTRVTLGLIRVVYGTDERSVVLLARPLTLLRFGGPEFLLDGDHGKVMWRIRGGCWSPAQAAAAASWRSTSGASTTSSKTVRPAFGSSSR